MTLPSRWPAILQAVMKGQPRAYADSHYPQWHPAPVTGLMNDPNGFIWFAGRYHLFYQWNPLDCDHRYKCWGHWSSADLVHWQHEPMALMPDEEYDRNGCYSGSAVDNNGVLTLCYTGNVKFDDGSRTAWQCLATQQPDGTFKKLGPVLALPEGYTGHVRDPKVWQHDGVWYMVLGAQDLQKRGKVLLFTSADLHHWASCGEIAGHGVNGLTEAGYMWECPDLFDLDGTHVLICCPQGLAREPHRYLNTYPATWTSGAFDHTRATFEHGELHELDAGFEFYAPQTTVAEDGRRILIGWMGLPDVEEEYTNPTAKDEGWQHCLTIPREITLHDGRLYQYPVEEMEALRGRCCEIDETQKNIEVWKPFELDLKLDSRKCRISVGDDLMFEADGREACLRLSEKAGAGRKQRKAVIPSGRLKEIRMLVDTTAVEIYLNHGEVVFSTRYYPGKTTKVVKLEADKIQGHIYELKEMTGIK